MSDRQVARVKVYGSLEEPSGSSKSKPPHGGFGSVTFERLPLMAQLVRDRWYKLYVREVIRCDDEPEPTESPSDLVERRVVLSTPHPSPRSPMMSKVQCPKCKSTKLGINRLVVECRDIETREYLGGYELMDFDNPKYTCECGHRFSDE